MEYHDILYIFDKVLIMNKLNIRRDILSREYKNKPSALVAINDLMDKGKTSETYKKLSTIK